MDNRGFTRIRQSLGKTQGELARLLCVSRRAIQSFEQGWREIPAGAERQLLFLLSLKGSSDDRGDCCWEILDCPAEWRENCAAWEYGGGSVCWFVNGTFCQGEFQEKWGEKIHLCRRCEVFQAMLSRALGD